MLLAFVVMAQLVVQPPSLPSLPEAPEVAGGESFCEDQLVSTTVKLDDVLEMTMYRDPSGRPVRAIVRRQDRKQMTCDPYFAWVSHDFHCGQGCGNPYTANGHAGGTSRSNACTNARQDGCAQTACSPGTYGYCGLIEKVSGVYYDAGGTCGYQYISTCGAVLNDNCWDWY